MPFGDGWVVNTGTLPLLKAKPSRWVDLGWLPNAHPAARSLLQQDGRRK